MTARHRSRSVLALLAVLLPTSPARASQPLLRRRHSEQEMHNNITSLLLEAQQAGVGAVGPSGGGGAGGSPLAGALSLGGAGVTGASLEAAYGGSGVRGAAVKWCEGACGWVWGLTGI